MLLSLRSQDQTLQFHQHSLFYLWRPLQS